jgi:hypothetical protein
VESEPEARSAAHRVAAEARKHTVIVFGCDVEKPTKNARKKKRKVPKRPRRKRKGRASEPIEKFGYLASRDGSRMMWHARQLAIGSTDHVSVDDARDQTFTSQPRWLARSF